MNDDENYLVCVTIEQPCVTDALQGNCHDCDVAIWISPSGLGVMSKTGAVPVCFSCASKKKIDEVKVEPLNEEQIKELIKEGCILHNNDPKKLKEWLERKMKDERDKHK